MKDPKKDIPKLKDYDPTPEPEPAKKPIVTPEEDKRYDKNDYFELSEEDRLKYNMTFRQKVGNFWYYNKGKILVFLMVAALITFLIVSAVTNPKADITVLYMGTSSLFPSHSEELEEHLESIFGDINQDGVHHVSLVNLYMPEGSTQMDYAQYQSLTIELATGRSSLYIVNEEAYSFLLANDALENLAKALKKYFVAEVGVLTDDFSVQITAEELFGGSLPDMTYGKLDKTYRLILRKTSGTDFVYSKEDSEKYFAALSYIAQFLDPYEDSAHTPS